MAPLTRALIMVLAVGNVLQWFYAGGWDHVLSATVSLIIMVLIVKDSKNSKPVFSFAELNPHINGAKPHFDRKTNRLISASGSVLGDSDEGGAPRSVDLDAEIAKRASQIKIERQHRRVRAEA
jgi:hypothetical protein